MAFALNTPVGRMGYRIEDGALTGLWFAPSNGLKPPPDCPVATQLGEFFQRERTAFDLPLAPAGSEFQQEVWRALLTIPFGETRSYQQIAYMVGMADGARAVGAANGANPIAIVIPCHRVIGSDGSLVGYGGGLDNKRRLLDFEHGILSLFD